MKKLIVVMCALAGVGCSAEKFPILHPKTGIGTEYPCGLHAYPYSVERPWGNEVVCCPERYAPNDHTGRCH